MPGDDGSSIPRDTEARKLEYARLCVERDRLRAARARFSAGLGPAPASAGIATAVTATLGKEPVGALLVIAVVLLAAMVCVGIAYDGKPAYRHLRAGKERSSPEPDETTDAWLAREIALERDLIGTAESENHWRRPFAQVANLQQGVDSERTGARLIDVLWVAVIAVLLAAVIN